MEGARAVTRELFDAVGGLNETISSGEDLFVTAAYRKQAKVIRPNLFVRHHLGHYSFAALMKKKFSYGRTAREYLRRSGAIGAPSAWGFIIRALKSYLST